MGLRPQIIGLSLDDFLATRTSDEYVKLVKEYKSYDTSDDLTEDEIKEREEDDESLKQLLMDKWFTHLQSTNTKAQKTPKKTKDDEEDEEEEEDDDGEYENNEDINAVMLMCNLYCAKNLDKIVGYPSDYYNSGGYFSEIKEAFGEGNLSEQDIQSLLYLSNGRTLLIEDADMDIVWASYSYLRKDEVSDLLKSLKRLNEEYHKAKESGTLKPLPTYEEEEDEESEEEGSEAQQPEDEDENDDDLEPKAKKQKLTQPTDNSPTTATDSDAKQIYIMKDYEEEFLKELIDWLSNMESKNLDLFMYKN